MHKVRRLLRANLLCIIIISEIGDWNIEHRDHLDYMFILLNFFSLEKLSQHTISAKNTYSETCRYVRAHIWYVLIHYHPQSPWITNGNLQISDDNETFDQFSVFAGVFSTKNDQYFDKIGQKPPTYTGHVEADPFVPPLL